MELQAIMDIDRTRGQFGLLQQVADLREGCEQIEIDVHLKHIGSKQIPIDEVL